ncbi:MAG: alpha/beta fold hydrolase [Acidobacteriota bacterium]|nr:alpha/beta fold hydrolase [Acidobacteriota bacterium]
MSVRQGHPVNGLLAACLLVATTWGCSAEFPEHAPPVIVIHGLGRTTASMAILSARLADAGFRVTSFGYPSRTEPVEALIDRLADQVDQCCHDDMTGVHFVTHSMGGVLVRSYLSRRPERHDGRVVMLSPPSQGSEIVDAFVDSEMLRALLGPAGARLGTGSAGIAGELPPVQFSLGIITGSRSLSPLGSWLIPGPDDGKVGVDRARLDGATDFLILPATHTFIMNRRDVADEVVHFLQHGQFRSPETR